jgi:hypothetical protein
MKLLRKPSKPPPGRYYHAYRCPEERPEWQKYIQSDN